MSGIVKIPTYQKNLKNKHEAFCPQTAVQSSKFGWQTVRICFFFLPSGSPSSSLEGKVHAGCHKRIDCSRATSFSQKTSHCVCVSLTTHQNDRQIPYAENLYIHFFFRHTALLWVCRI